MNEVHAPETGQPPPPQESKPKASDSAGQPSAGQDDLHEALVALRTGLAGTGRAFFALGVVLFAGVVTIRGPGWGFLVAWFLASGLTWVVTLVGGVPRLLRVARHRGQEGSLWVAASQAGWTHGTWLALALTAAGLVAVPWMATLVYGGEDVHRCDVKHRTLATIE